MRTSLVALLLVVGCSGEGSGGGDPSAATPTTAEGPCATGCAYDVECEQADLAACTTRCVDEVSGWARLDAVVDISACMADLTCDQDDGVCLLGVEPMEIHRTWQARCLSQLVEPMCDITAHMCSVEPDPNDDNAGQVRFIAPAIVEEMLACLDGADCAARTSCMQTVLLTYGVNLL